VNVWGYIGIIAGKHVASLYLITIDETII